MSQTPERQVKANPCIHTVETGKHEWNTLHSVHQANDRYWFRQCPTCGWIDTEDFAREVLAKARDPHAPETPEKTAIDAVMIGGNHLASALIGYVSQAPWHDALAKLRDWTYGAILERFGQPVADMWVAWKAIMDLRDSREAAAGITEPPLIVQRLRRKESPTPRSPEQP
jgi:hypothetical protein